MKDEPVDLINRTNKTQNRFKIALSKDIGLDIGLVFDTLRQRIDSLSVSDQVTSSIRTQYVGVRLVAGGFIALLHRFDHLSLVIVIYSYSQCTCIDWCIILIAEKESIGGQNLS